MGQIGELAHKFLVFGWSGVDLFFVISGFLIGGIVFDKMDSYSFYSTFYGRRFLRIVPLYAISLTILFLSALFVEPQDHKALEWLFGHPMAAWSYLSFTQNIAMVFSNTFGANWIAITWSLAVEEQFYLIAPFVLRSLPRNRVPVFLVAGIVAAPFIRLVTFDAIGPLACYVLFPCRMDSLFAGVLLAHMVRQKGSTDFLQSQRMLFSATALLSFCLIVFFGYNGESVFSKNMTVFGYSAFSIFYASLLSLCICTKNASIKSCAPYKFLRVTGIRCYSIYLLHQPCIGVCFYIMASGAPFIKGYNDFPAFIAAIALLTILTALSWRLIEHPGIVLGRQLRYLNGGPCSSQTAQRLAGGKGRPQT